MNAKWSSSDRQLGFVIRIVFLCLLWYGVSSAANVFGKLLLRDFPYPTTRAMTQLLCTVSFLYPTLLCLDVPRPKPFRARYYATTVVPLAVAKFSALALSHVSIWKIPVSYAHTVKATMPLFVVVLSRIILRERQSTAVYLSLLPIIVGVYVATVTELAFDAVGLFAALTSTFIFSLQNIFSKKVLREHNIHHLRLLQTLATISLILFIPFWALFDGGRLFFSSSSSTPSPGLSLRVTTLALADGFLAFAQNMIAFTLLSLVSPVSYSVANASKRIVVICVSIALLRNPVTWTNALGMFIAITGVFLYNKAKYEQRGEKAVATVPPFRFKEVSLVNDAVLDVEASSFVRLHHPGSDWKGGKESRDWGSPLTDVRVR